MKETIEISEGQKAYAIGVAKTIIAQIIAQIGKSAFWSWGVEKTSATYTSANYPAVLMHVNGRQYTGAVVVELDEGRDLYNVYTVKDGKTSIEAKGLFCDTLGTWLDQFIEVGEDEKEYEAFCNNPAAVFADAFKKTEEHKNQEGESKQ
jgi:hypothetical protein